MTKTNKKIYLLTIISLFFVFFGLTKITQAQTPPDSCYSGSWVQPTCNPVTSDPGSCGILPPLFSGANCGQHTGYLRIQNESDPDQQKYWVVLRGTATKRGLPASGQILVGDTLGTWVYNDVLDPGIFAKGPITSGEFNTWPGVGAGGIVAQNDLRSLRDLSVVRQSRLSNTTIIATPVVINTIPASTLYVDNNTANAGTIIYVKQQPGSSGRILDMYTSDSNNVYFDTLGYLNATKDFQIRIDADNNGTNSFRINNGDGLGGTPVFSVDESGYAQISGNLYAAGDGTIRRKLTADSIVANSGQGIIHGKFVDSISGNPCTNEQLLVYRVSANVGNWFCTATTNVGNNTVENLLQTLQAGADASAFTEIVTIGNESNGYLGLGTLRPRARLEINDDSTNDPFRILIRENCNFIAASNGGAGGISVGTCDNPPSGGLYVAGSFGLGVSTPTEKMEISDNSLGTARLRITDLGQNAELQLKYGSLNGQHWGLYVANNIDDSFRIWGNSTDRFVINTAGNVGIGLTNPTSKLHVNGTIRGTYTDGSGNLCANNQILVYNSGSGSWVCSASIPGGSQDLLSVLGAGSNASTFTANTSIGGTLSLGGNLAVGRIFNPGYSIHVNTSTAQASLALETTGTGRGANIELRNSDTSQIPYIDLTKGWTSGNTPDYSGRIAYWSDNDFQIIQANNNPLSFWTNNTKRMTIAGNGFVGIGIDPTSMFQINGAAGTGWNSGLKITRADQIGADFRINVTTGSTLFRNFLAGAGYAFRNSADATLLYILSDGKVGIGYNPTSKLTVGPTTNVEGVRIISSNYSPFIIRNTANDKDIFRIKQDGELTHFVNGSPALSFSTDMVLNVNNKVKTNVVETEFLTHYEDTGTNSTYYTWGDDGLDFCNPEAYLDCQDKKLAQVIFDYIGNFFKIPQALAEPVREYVYRPPTNAAPCNAGDVTLYTAPSQAKIYFDCSDTYQQTAPYISYRYCQTTTAAPSEVTKIQFEGTPGLAKPGLTKIKDNLVVEKNFWGDGITSGCHNVGSSGVPQKLCPDGEFMAGINIVTNMYDSTIICCPL